LRKNRNSCADNKEVPSERPGTPRLAYLIGLCGNGASAGVKPALDSCPLARMGKCSRQEDFTCEPFLPAQKPPISPITPIRPIAHIAFTIEIIVTSCGSSNSTAD
jgi:hypothetical protein